MSIGNPPCTAEAAYALLAFVEHGGFPIDTAGLIEQIQRDVRALSPLGQEEIHQLIDSGEVQLTIGLAMCRARKYRPSLRWVKGQYRLGA